MTTPKRKKKSRPKLQPIDSSIQSSSSQDELFRDVVLTRARSEDGLEKSMDGDRLQQETVSVANSSVASVSSLKAAADNNIHIGAPHLPEPVAIFEAKRDEEISAPIIADEESNSVSSDKSCAERISPLILPDQPSNLSEVSSVKGSVIQVSLNRPDSTSTCNKKDTNTNTTAPESHHSPTENYASKYLPDLSPPCTPEGNQVHLKSPQSTLETKTPDTTETDYSTHHEEESLEGIEQPLLEPKRDMQLDVESTPIVSNVSGPIETSTSTNKCALDDITRDDSQMTTPQTKGRGSNKRGKRLQPRSSLFSPDHPKTPDEDLYDIFGFNLHKSGVTNATVDAKEGSLHETVSINLVDVMDQVETARSTGKTQSLHNTTPNACRETSSPPLDFESVTSPRNRDITLDPSKSCRRTSSVSFSETRDSSRSLNTSKVHLIGSKSDGSENRQDSDSESSFTSDEMSYFNESRASTEQQHEQNSASLPMENALPKIPSLPVRTQTSTGSPIDMKLSLSISEEDDGINQEELVLYQTYNTAKGDSFGSSLVESASESEEEEEPSRVESSDSFTSGSDDAGVTNELNAYLLSSKIEALNNESTAYGRLTPVEGGHAQSALRRKVSSNDTPTPTNADGAKYIYDDVQSAIVDAKANSGAHKPTSSMDNSVCSALQQYNINESIKPKQMHSPGGAFQSTPQRQIRTKDIRPSTFDSLTYSADRDAYYDATDETPFRQMKQEFDAEMASCNTIYEENDPVRPSRWGVLFCISVLNMLAGWTCFSVASIASSTGVFNDISTPEYLVSVFLFASCIGCFVEPALRRKVGLRKTLVLGSLLLMIGSLVKSAGAPIFEFDDIGESWRLYLSFFTVGCSHPFYQNSFSIVANAWFHSSEQTLASIIALNSYKLGIMLSFTFGTQEVVSEEDVDAYLQLMSLISVLAFIFVAFVIDDAPSNTPSTPNQSLVQRRKSRTMQQKKVKKKRQPTKQSIPSTTTSDFEQGEAPVENGPLLETQHLPQVPSMSKQYGSIPSLPAPRQNSLDLVHQTPYHSPIDTSHNQIWPLIKECFSLSEFSHCCVVYAAAGVITNTLLTFLSDILKTNGEQQLDIWVIGGCFPLITMISTWIFSKFVNRSRRIYKLITSLLVLVAITLSMCSMRLGASWSMDICVLMVGFFVGPLRYLSTTQGSRVARPSSEDDVLIAQRFLSNGISAVCIPIFKKIHLYSVAGGSQLQDFTLSFYFLIAVTVITVFTLHRRV